MEKAKQMSELSSSFTAVLFGPNDSSKPSSSGFVESIFGPNNKYGNSDHMSQRSKESFNKKEMSSIPYHYNSSIYYGAQDVYSPTSQNTIPQHNTFNKDAGDFASRGNWWKDERVFSKQLLLLEVFARFNVA
ncbi:uncharacterized protein LOC111385429 isoform X2 [Olea europaea var. sylvestris]|uniref:Uncharacterized protein n=1 Tax=Olea europaea subsp. europaea TaxID=158383 RepID=A0A8S0TVU0_OLEEU|nr:uncharacterized protein LOC111385429 isoform X2 [Olea europaea var. sylvestris]CAA3010094.1 Hypothetical predicted protein [Olea europaea subsp. europaea]